MEAYGGCIKPFEPTIVVIFVEINSDMNMRENVKG